MLDFYFKFNDKMGYKVYNPYAVTAIATISALMSGFDVSSVSAFVDQKDYLSYFDNPNSITQGGITAAMTGGSFLSACVCGYVMDGLGRLPLIRLSAVFWMIGCAIQCSAQNIAQLICGRLISGIGIGFASSATPVYIAEIAPKRIRGTLGGLYQWALTWGIMIMFYIGYGCSYIKGPASFRTAWGLMMLPSVLLLVGSLFIAESPRWLAKNGRWEEATHIIAMIQANGDVNSEDVLIELGEIQAEEQKEQCSNFGLMDLFRKENLSRTLVGLFTKIWQQLTGMNVLMYYIVYMFQMAGFHGNNLLVSASIQYVINMAMTVPGILLIDRVGRRKALMAGSFGLFTCLLCLVCVLSVYAIPITDPAPDQMITITVNNKKASKAAISMSFLFVACFAPTWGPVTWIYCSEIFPTSQRAHANGLTTGINWLFNFALAMFVPTAFKNITWKTYIIFLVFDFLMIIHVFVCFPETKGKTLEEIALMWDAKIPAWKTASWTPDLSQYQDESNNSDQSSVIVQHWKSPTPSEKMSEVP